MNFNLRKHDRYREAEDKLTELKTRHLELGNEVCEMERACSKPDDIQDEASALLHDSHVATATITRDQLEQLRHEHRVVAAAIEMQRKVVRAEHSVASEQLLERARPAYRAIVKRMASILAALREAAVDEHTFRHQLIDAGANVTGDFINPFRDCGEPDGGSERQDTIAIWEREAKNSGAL